MKKIIAGLFVFCMGNVFSLSISETSKYPDFCKLAAEDDTVFKSFKSNPRYTHMLEHVDYAAGKDLLEIIRNKYSVFLERIEELRENDLVGAPRAYSYEEYGVLSPTTLRYMKVSGDLIDLFGDLNGKRIVEIGVGYGGQCKVLSSLIDFKDYTLIDLPEANALAERYLSTLGVPNTNFLSCKDDFEQEEYDLLISNFAFSEISADEQEVYIKKVINHSKMGYMTCNFVSAVYKIKSLSLEEITSLMTIPNRKITLLPEDPVSHVSNIVITWKEEL